MQTEEVRDRIAQALQEVGDKVVALGSRIYFYAGDDEFEIVVKTMQPKRPDSADDDDRT